MGDFRGVSQECGTLYLIGRCNGPKGFLIPNSRKYWLVTSSNQSTSTQGSCCFEEEQESTLAENLQLILLKDEIGAIEYKVFFLFCHFYHGHVSCCMVHFEQIVFVTWSAQCFPGAIQADLQVPFWGTCKVAWLMTLQHSLLSEEPYLVHVLQIYNI